MAPALTTPFSGFSAGATRFFRELAAHQNREWFAEHKAEYEQLVQAPLAALVQAVTARLASTPLPLVGDAKRSVFRIYRDVRFSADKSPYKTNAGCIFSRNGSKTSLGVIYFQLGADEIFAAAGFYLPPPDDLRLLRAAIAGDPEDWAEVRAGLTRKGLTLITEGALQRLPKGFERAPPAVQDDLKLKSWAVSRNIVPSVARSAELVDAIATLALASAGLLEFGWSALEAG